LLLLLAATQEHPGATARNNPGVEEGACGGWTTAGFCEVKTVPAEVVKSSTLVFAGLLPLKKIPCTPY